MKDDAGHPRVKTDDGCTRAESETAWDDGLIARRVSETAPGQETHAPSLVLETKTAVQAPPLPLAYDGPLRSRLDALRELVGSSRTRLDSRTLAEASRVLDEATARRKLSGEHTVVAIAGATGSGKSQLFNALAGVAISETGVRRPTTAAPIACSWSDGAATLIDRLGIPGRLRRRPLQSPEAEAQLRGLVLVDLPDHDSAAVQHREQVDRILALVDAVIWVVDPEKYADAMLHERYLRPMAGHGEVTFVVLNQVDRLPGEAADQVLDDLRRLLDEDGIALGEYGEPGATVMALSALTGDGIGELRESLGQFLAERGAAARRISADLDAAAARLRPVYSTGRRTGLSEEARDEFADRLADAVGATAAGQAAERAWRRNANRACGTPGCGCGAGSRAGGLDDGPTVGTGTRGRGGHGPTARRTGGAYGGGPGGPRAARALGAGGARGGRARCAGAVGGTGRDGVARHDTGGAAAAARLVAGRRARTGLDDDSSDHRRAVAAGADHRVHGAEPRGAGAADVGRHHRRPRRRVGQQDGGARTGQAVRARSGTATARGSGRVREGAGTRSGGGGVAAISGGTGAVRAGHGGVGAGRMTRKHSMG